VHAWKASTLPLKYTASPSYPLLSPDPQDCFFFSSTSPPPPSYVCVCVCVCVCMCVCVCVRWDLFRDRVLRTICLGLALNCNSPDFWLLSS
jgi:hypothetical protein